MSMGSGVLAPARETVGVDKHDSPLEEMMIRMDQHVENLSKRVDALVVKVSKFMPNVPAEALPEFKPDFRGASQAVEALARIDAKMLTIDCVVASVLEKIEV